MEGGQSFLPKAPQQASSHGLQEIADLEGEPPLLGLIMLRAKSQSHGITAHPSPTVRHLLTLAQALASP